MWKDNFASHQKKQIGQIGKIEEFGAKFKTKSESYYQIIQEQIAERVVKKVNNGTNCDQ